MTLAEMRDRMTNTEYLSWRAFYNFRAAQQELESKRAKVGKRGR